MSFFSARNISAGYDQRPVIENISFDLDQGEILGILGANGSGKTTLLKALCGILPHEGRCTLDGAELEGLSARKIAAVCSYVPQRSGIHIDISALDVVLMGFNPRLGLLERPGADMHAAARNALAQVGLAGREHENYLHLSEGQKQLCILARTLAARSRLLLLDEPESALDFRRRYRMLEILRKWIREENAGAIVTLHDPSLALNYCDRLLVLAEGRVLGCVSPRTDAQDTIETMLRWVYGPVSLQTVTARSGRTQLVMLKEDGP